MSEILIRSASLADAPRLREIYRYYVEHTAVSFEYETPTLEAFEGRMTRTMARYPYLVAVLDGEIAGYAYAGAFVGRPAYAWSCELTIYLDPAMRRKGCGRALYNALETALREMGFTNLYACIGEPETPDEYLTHDSRDFHARMGFRTVGTFHNCGCKFGRWYHMIWMEKLIAPHATPPCPAPCGK